MRFGLRICGLIFLHICCTSVVFSWWFHRLHQSLYNAIYYLWVTWKFLLVVCCTKRFFWRFRIPTMSFEPTLLFGESCKLWVLWVTVTFFVTNFCLQLISCNEFYSITTKKVWLRPRSHIVTSCVSTFLKENFLTRSMEKALKAKDNSSQNIMVACSMRFCCLSAIII